MVMCAADDHHRRSIRLRGYDYASHGAYFVTVCIEGRMRLLGEVAGNEMRFNPAGEMVREVWENVTHMYPGVSGDTYVIMPNHIHAIVLLAGDAGPGQGWNPAPTGGDGAGVVGATLRGRPDTAYGGDVAGHGDVFSGQGRSLAPTGGDDFRQVMVGHQNGPPAPTGGDQATRPITVGDVVGRFKTYTTRLYGEGVASRGWPPYDGRLWQRNYYEHIVRNERELVAIREYIHNNPIQWAMDRENPDRL